MIRHTYGNDFLLIAQDDHARAAGRIAEQIGNDRFAGPTPRGPALRGVALHDCGWPLHDDAPTLNPQGLPLHVLEVSMGVATHVWGESARRAAATEEPYAALLVSLHALYLSGVAKRHDATPHERYQNRHELFLLNQFQQYQIEHQESLRRQLGLRTDIPLRLGLADRGIDAREDLLSFNYAWLQSSDAISLDACCSDDLFPKLKGVMPRPGAAPVDLRMSHPGRGQIALDPWPFGVDAIDLEVPCRRVPGRTHASEEAFHATYAGAPVEQYELRVRPG